MRIMTDLSAERYRTVVSETEVERRERYAEMTKKLMEVQEFQDAVKGCHDLVDKGRLDIYTIEK